MEFNKYPSIDQLRNVVHQVNQICKATQQSLPKLTFNGTIKAHGTNAAVCWSREGGTYAQSRKHVITVEKDNAGFARFVEEKKSVLQVMIDRIAFSEADMQGLPIQIFGEWCGGNIQSGVALTGLPKMFIIFGVKIDDKWITCDQDYLRSPEESIYNINDFPITEMEIDFANPEASVNALVALTEQTEAECPIGKAFGVSGIGEGLVWSSDFLGNHLKFKVKGEKHSSSKVKKLATVDPEKLASIKEFVEYSITENRLKQGIEQVFTSENVEPIVQGIGKFIKWVMTDVNKEETDTLVANGLTMKEVSKDCTTKVRSWFMASV